MRVEGILKHDSATGHGIVIQFEHHEVHDGAMHCLCRSNATLGNGSSEELRIAVGAKELHITYMMAAVTGLEPGELVWSPCRTHIYKNQTLAVEEQIKRIPHPFPKLIIKNSKPKDSNILSFEWSDFELINYKPYGKLKNKIHMNA